MGNFKFGRDFQMALLRMLMVDSLFAARCFQHLKENYFWDDVLSWFYDLFKRHYDLYDRLPDVITVLNDIDNRIIEADQQEKYADAFEEICQSKTINAEYIKKHITEFVVANRYKELWDETRELYNHGKLKEACDITQERIEEIQRIDFFGDDAVQFESIDEILETLKNRNEQKIPTGIALLDEYLVGGLPIGIVSTIIAAYGVGKTFFLVNLAVEAAKMGHKVLFAFHEGRKEQILTRFLSKISRLPYNQFLTGSILHEDNREKINRAKNLLQDKILIKPLIKVGSTVNDLYLYAKEKKKDFDFDILISDYAQLLEPKKTYRELRHDMAKVWVTLNQMANELDIAIATAAQFNREGAKLGKRGDRIVRSDNVKECIDIAQTSEIILTLNPYIDNSNVICLDKNRDGPKGKLIRCETDFASSQFYGKHLRHAEINLEEVEEKLDNFNRGTMYRNLPPGMAESAPALVAPATDDLVAVEQPDDFDFLQ